MKVKILTHSRSETIALGTIVGRELYRGDVVLVNGALGAGKTALITGMVRGTGSDDYVSSPTYAITQHYEGPMPLVHADLYRVTHPRELDDIGFEETFDGMNIVLIEWAERATELERLAGLVVRCSSGGAQDDRIFDIERRGLDIDRWVALCAALGDAVVLDAGVVV